MLSTQSNNQRIPLTGLFTIGLKQTSLFVWGLQVLNKVITVYAALCSEVKKLKYEVGSRFPPN